MEMELMSNYSCFNAKRRATTGDLTMLKSVSKSNIFVVRLKKPFQSNI